MKHQAGMGSLGPHLTQERRSMSRAMKLAMMILVLLVASSGVVYAAWRDCRAGQPCWGTNAPDDMFGSGGADRMYGLGSNDWMNGESGNDYVHGGPGSDQNGL